jgi:hypothetical protein
MHRDTVVGQLKRYGFAVGCIASVLMFAYLFEDWRGRRAWAEFTRDAATRGQKIHWREHTQERVPDAENFAVNKVIDRIGYKGQSDPADEARFKEHPLLRAANFNLTWRDGQSMDLHGVCLGLDPDAPSPAHRVDAARIILRKLAGLEEDFRVLREAARKPQAQVRGDGTPDGLFPNMPALRALGQLLVLSASAKLAAGNVEEAYWEGQALERLGTALMGEPHLVGAMIGTAFHEGLALQVFWEGLSAGAWSDEHLAGFQRKFSAIDLIARIDHAFRAGERAGVNYLVERQPRWEVFAMNTPANTVQGKWERLYYRCWPKGWMYQNQIRHNRLIEETAMSFYSVAEHRFFPEKSAQSIQRIQHATSGLNPFKKLAAMAIPNYARAGETAARAQTHLEMAALTCALERFRRARGEYPEQLEVLRPEWINRLPHDLVTGEPFRYSWLGKGQYHLYAVGWDGKDDAGKAVGTAPAKPNEGDWVWPTPP